jgi:exocyst complex component 2
MTVVQELDKSLFNGYTKPKVKAVTSILRDGILDPKVDWHETPQPTGKITFFWAGGTLIGIYVEIRPYMFETLIYLVRIHAQLSSVSEALVERTLGHMGVELAEEALRCFKQVKAFGMGGMLRVSQVCILSC